MEGDALYGSGTEVKRSIYTFTQKDFEQLASRLPLESYPQDIRDVMAMHGVEVPYTSITKFDLGISIDNKKWIYFSLYRTPEAGYFFEQQYHRYSGNSPNTTFRNPSEEAVVSKYEDLPLLIGGAQGEIVSAIIQWRLDVGK